MSKPFQETYVSVDVETDGPIPGRNSMLSLGAAAFDPNKDNPGERYIPISTFEINLCPLPEATHDPDTAAWWNSKPEAWAAATKDPVRPEVGIPKFIEWLKSLPSRPVFVGYPAGFDFTFVHWYNVAFGGGRSESDPFGFSCVDIKSYAAAALRVPYLQAIKRNMPKRWFKLPAYAKAMGATVPRHTHKALDDAIGQGVLFINILWAIDGEGKCLEDLLKKSVNFKPPARAGEDGEPG